MNLAQLICERLNREGISKELFPPYKLRMHSHIEAKGCYLSVLDSEIEVWINGDVNPTDWLMDHVIYEVDMSIPGSTLDEVINTIKDIGVLVDMMANHRPGDTGVPVPVDVRKSWIKFRDKIQRHKPPTPAGRSISHWITKHRFEDI